MTFSTISDQFQGLPMESLIGGPLTAACKAQVMLAHSTAEYINTVGFDHSDAGEPTLRNVAFQYERPVETAGTDDAAPTTTQQKFNMVVPMLSIVPVPNLQVDAVDVTFDMEVKSSSQTNEKIASEAALDASGKIGYGPFKLSAKVHGKVSAHKENTRSTDNSAKYHVEVKATNHTTPEGLSRVFDILAASIAPVPVPAST